MQVSIGRRRRASWQDLIRAGMRPSPRRRGLHLPVPHGRRARHPPLASRRRPRSPTRADRRPRSRSRMAGRKLTIEGNEPSRAPTLRRVIETRPRSRLTFWRARPEFDSGGLRARPRAHRSVSTRARVTSRRGSIGGSTSKQTERAEILTSSSRSRRGRAPSSPRSRSIRLTRRRAGPSRRPNPQTATKSAAETGRSRSESRFARPTISSSRPSCAPPSSTAATPGHDEAVRPGAPRPRGRGPPLRDHAGAARPLRPDHDRRTREGRQPRSSTRELTFKAGDRFSSPASRSPPPPPAPRPLHVDRARLEDRSREPRAGADLEIVLREKKPRELRIGAGYSTEERARAHVRWQHRNWLGGGRRLARRRALFESRSARPSSPSPSPISATATTAASSSSRCSSRTSPTSPAIRSRACPPSSTPSRPKLVLHHRPARRDRGGSGRRGGGEGPGSAACATRAW